MSDPVSVAALSTRGPRWLVRWMMLLRAVGRIQAWILLTLCYVVFIFPVGLVYRLIADPLRLRRHASNWQSLPRQYGTMEEAKEQF